MRVLFALNFLLSILNAINNVLRKVQIANKDQLDVLLFQQHPTISAKMEAKPTSLHQSNTFAEGRILHEKGKIFEKF